MTAGWKRKADPANAVDLTGDGLESETLSRPAKVSRIAPPGHTQNTSSEQRFGEDATFVPLSQASAIDGDDAEAEDLIQGSQDYDVSISYILYGAYQWTESVQL